MHGDWNYELKHTNTILNIVLCQNINWHPQYVIYDSFIADIGGYLGLLLGQSAFGVYSTWPDGEGKRYVAAERVAERKRRFLFGDC
jgi:hypothetical protein